MNLIIGNSYKIVLKINNAVLTYTCVITDVDDDFISFKDKYGKLYNYNKSLIIQIVELEDGR